MGSLRKTAQALPEHVPDDLDHLHHADVLVLEDPAVGLHTGIQLSTAPVEGFLMAL
jgi:hypothetical protein